MSESYTTMIPIPSVNSVNTGLSAAKVATLHSIFGDFPHLGNNCGEVQNEKVKALLDTRQLFVYGEAHRATGIAPALDSLEVIFNEVKSDHPDLYSIVGTEGMLCYRAVRGYPGTPSNHAAGTAIDLTVGGQIGELGSHVWPAGMLVLYGYFHRHGWFSGVGYHNGRPDGMHFEVADETLKQWHQQGKI